MTLDENQQESTPDSETDIQRQTASTS